MAWDQAFSAPIILPDGRKLLTLRDAAEFITKGAEKSARRVEQQYGLEELGPWENFEWGVINGKLSAWMGAR